MIRRCRGCRRPDDIDQIQTAIAAAADALEAAYVQGVRLQTQLATVTGQRDESRAELRAERDGRRVQARLDAATIERLRDLLEAALDGKVPPVLPASRELQLAHAALVVYEDRLAAWEGRPSPITCPRTCCTGATS